jgi:hypothetical protein
MDIEEAARLNASLLAVMVSVGDKFEAITIRNLTRTVDLGSRFGIPTLGVTAVGKDMARDARYLSMASRSLAPPGYSFHGVGDFDVGKKGYGIYNFTEKFTGTNVYHRLADLGYLKFRYGPDNNLGVRFEPWHIKVI